MKSQGLAGNNNQVPPGYKQTEVGVIPEDWEIYNYSNICKKVTVGVVIKPTQYYVPIGVPAFRSANIQENKINLFDLVFISAESNAKLRKSQLQKGDILTVRTGYPGTSAVVSSDLVGSNCIDLLISRPSSGFDSYYVALWINSDFGKNQVISQQGGLAQQHFNVRELRKLLIAIPPLAEQKTIASVLSDVDELISALDKLIAKKRHIKTATMQQLLTGKTRLPGFGEGMGYKKSAIGLIPEDWEVVTLGSIGQSLIGLTYKPENISNYGRLVLRSSNIKDNNLIYTDNVYIDDKIPLN
jgi:type I restriction enzyme S subunit